MRREKGEPVQDATMLTKEDLDRDLGKDAEDARRWREIGYDLPAARFSLKNLPAWAEGWPAAIRRALAAEECNENMAEREAELLSLLAEWLHDRRAIHAIAADCNAERKHECGCLYCRTLRSL